MKLKKNKIILRFKNSEEAVDAFLKLTELSERNTSKEPSTGYLDKEKKIEIPLCPSCKDVIDPWGAFRKRTNFCPTCRQRLDWKD